MGGGLSCHSAVDRKRVRASGAGFGGGSWGSQMGGWLCPFLGAFASDANTNGRSWPFTTGDPLATPPFAKPSGSGASDKVLELNSENPSSAAPVGPTDGGLRGRAPQKGTLPAIQSFKHHHRKMKLES